MSSYTLCRSRQLLTGETRCSAASTLARHLRTPQVDDSCCSGLHVAECQALWHGKPDATSSAAHKTNVYEDCAVKQLTIQRGTITRLATFTQRVIICKALVCTPFFTTCKTDGCRVLETDANIMNNSAVLSHNTAKINTYQLFFHAANVFSS